LWSSRRPEKKKKGVGSHISNPGGREGEGKEKEKRNGMGRPLKAVPLEGENTDKLYSECASHSRCSGCGKKKREGGLRFEVAQALSGGEKGGFTGSGV